MGVLKSVVVSSVSPRTGWMGKVRSSERERGQQALKDQQFGWI